MKTYSFHRDIRVHLRLFSQPRGVGATHFRIDVDHKRPVAWPSIASDSNEVIESIPRYSSTLDPSWFDYCLSNPPTIDRSIEFIEDRFRLADVRNEFQQSAGSEISRLRVAFSRWTAFDSFGRDSLANAFRRGCQWWIVSVIDHRITFDQSVSCSASILVVDSTSTSWSNIEQRSDPQMRAVPPQTDFGAIRRNVRASLIRTVSSESSGNAILWVIILCVPDAFGAARDRWESHLVD